MNFKKGMCVEFKSGNTDPDSGISVAGWSGRIIEGDNENKMLEIELDSVTLINLPDSYMRHSLDGGYDYLRYFIEMDEVEIINPKDTLQQVEEIQKELEARYHDYDLYGEEPIPFSKVAQGQFHASLLLPQDFGAWIDFLEDKLKFPFAVVITESHGPRRAGHKMRALSLYDWDNKYGIFARCKESEGDRIDFPLCDMEAVDQKSENYKWLRRYVVWFANR